jgi:hypothetical protein
MSKIIIATRISTPEDGGFPDHCRIVDDTNGMVLWQENPWFGTNPNSVNPKTGQKWFGCYAQIAAGSMTYICRETKKHGKCLVLNVTKEFPAGGPCATTRKNFNPETLYPGRCEAYACQIHRGYRGGEENPWRGSTACQTVAPEYWDTFIGHFEIGETGIYQLIDETI